MSASRIPDEPTQWSQAFYRKGHFYFGSEGCVVPCLGERAMGRAFVALGGAGFSIPFEALKKIRPRRRSRVPILMHFANQEHRPSEHRLELHIYYVDPRGTRAIARPKHFRFDSFQVAMRRLMRESS